MGLCYHFFHMKSLYVKKCIKMTVYTVKGGRCIADSKHAPVKVLKRVSLANPILHECIGSNFLHKRTG